MKPPSCLACVGANWPSRGFTQIEGSGGTRVLIVGEASGEAESNDELPFRPYAESGSVMERAFARLGLPRDMFRITNVLRCRPPANKLAGAPYEAAAIASCRPHLEAEIRSFQPRAILAVGGVAAKALTGLSGPRLGIDSIRGFILPSIYGVPIIPTWHPAYLRRGKMGYLGVLIADIQRAVEVARNGAPKAPPTHYITSPSAIDVMNFVDQLRDVGPEALLAFDIETDYSHAEDEEAVPLHEQRITLVQFSLSPTYGIAIPWTDANVRDIQRILVSPNPKVGHNAWQFDVPRLRAAGCKILGIVDDSMWAWHHLQPDLPRGLQSMVSHYCPEIGPWKHTSGMDLATYGCIDVDVLQRVWPRLRADLEQRDVWRGYERHVRNFWPILERMSQRGLPVSVERQQEFAAYLKGELGRIDQGVQALLPDSLRNCSPTNGFVREPKVTEGLTRRTFLVQPVHRGLCACVTEDGEITKKCPSCKGRGYVKQKISDALVAKERWCRLLPFKASQLQLVRYMRHRGHRVPKAIGENRDTTGKLQLERMAKETKDPLYAKVLEYRSVEKMLSTYIWALSPIDNRVHAEFKFSPATGQLAASNPNVLTIPNISAGKKGTRFAAGFRRTIHAGPGRCIAEVDMSGFHTSTFAFEAKDPAYFRLANVIADPHSFLTAIMLRLKTAEEMLAMDDDALRAYLSEIKGQHKTVRDGQAKPGILGYALGLGANKLFEQNRYDPDTGAGFKSKREAAGVIDTLRRVFPRGYAYQNEIRAEAQRLGRLHNAHGFHRYFWDVVHRDPRSGDAALGDDAEAAIAFNVQVDAHGMLKEAILRMQGRGWLERYRLINIVHDSVIFEPDLEDLRELLTNISAELEKPSEFLRDPVLCPDGLVVKAEAKVGWDMAEMKKPSEFLKLAGLSAARN